MGYGDLHDLGGGRFRFEVQYPLQVSPLELYLAGFIPAEQVPPMFYVTNPHSYDPPAPVYGGTWSAESYGESVSFSGTRVDFTVADIVASNGPRQPAFGVARTAFRCGFVLVCENPSACRPDALAIVESQRAAFGEAFRVATGGRASMDTRL